MTDPGTRRMTAIPPFLTAPAGSPLPLPRLLVVLAHPDDEVLALGARLERLSHSRLLCTTDGAPADGTDMRAHGFSTREAYRDARRAELYAALALAGVPASCSAILQVEPEVPGAPTTVADQGSSRRLVALTRALRREIDSFQPDAILTHPYEGGHPDHDSCAFAVHAALTLPGVRPPLLEAPSYFSRAVLGQGAGIATNQFLPGGQQPVTRHALTSAEQQRKQQRLDCFPSQASTLAQFRTDQELFRLAPHYDFTRPAHAGHAFYDAFPWGTTSAQFRELAAVALRTLRAEPSQ